MGWNSHGGHFLMATYTKINDWMENLHEAGVAVLTDTIGLALSNTAPASETPNPTTDTNGVKANVTEIAYTNYSDDLTVDRVLTNATKLSTTSSGTYTWDYGADIVVTASGGAIANFRYLYMFDDTIASPVDPLIAVWDHGSVIALGTDDSATFQINASGFYTVA